MSEHSHLLAPYLRRHWRALAVAGGGSIVSAAAEVARPFPLKLVIDRVVRGHGAGRFTLTSGDVTMLGVVAAMVVVIALCDAGASYLVDVRLQSAGERIVHDLRAALYGHLQRLSLTFHDRRPTGDLVTRVTGDVNAVGDLFSESLGTIATSALLLVGMGIVTIRLDPVIALAIFSVTPVLAAVTTRFRRRMKSVAREQRATEGEIASIANEALSSMRVVKSLGSERFERNRVIRRSQDVQRTAIRGARIEGRFTGIIDVTGAVASAAVLVLGVTRVAGGHLSVGDLVVVNSYVRRIYRPLRDLARQGSRVSKALARGDRIAEVLAADDVLEEPGRGYTGTRADGHVELKGVTFAYDGAPPVLHDVSLDVPAGRRTAIVGPSGAGKSTIASLLARFYDPTSGTVLVDGRDARTCKRAWLREQVGLVLQDTVLFSGTVSENIAYGTHATPGEVEAAARAGGAHDFIQALPAGYDTVLGPGGVGLSGGQRQRIAIARTLLRDPPILVLDEPTTGLDAESEADVLAGLDVLMRGRTVVMITHSLALAGTADRVVVVDGGTVIQAGRPGELLGHEGVFRRLAGLQGITAGRSALPEDPALPAMALLLDPEAMAPVLRRSLGPVEGAGPWPDVRVHCLRYKPATNLVVHYLVAAEGDWHHATAMISTGSGLRRRAARPENQALARQVDGRSPAATPLFYDEATGALVQWLPLDLRLPGLAAAPETLLRSLPRVTIRGGPAGAQLLTYRPRRRAVIRLGDTVLKIYASDADYQRAVRGLRVAPTVPGVPTPGLVGALPDLRATVQNLVAGGGVTSPEAVAADAGRLIAAFAGPAGAGPAAGMEGHEAGLERLDPAHQLRAAARSASLAVAVVPSLDRRVHAVLGELERRQPHDLALVRSHGDFHAGQLLSGAGGLVLIDVDELCRGPAALDLGTFAAHVVRGTAPDTDAAGAVLEGLVEGYGSRPDGLGWYAATAILRRSPFPFRYLHERWPDAVAAQVDAAEAALRW